MYWSLLNVTVFDSGRLLGSIVPSLWTGVSVLIILLLKNVAVMVTVVCRATQIGGDPARTGPVIRALTPTSSDYLWKPVLSAHQKLLLFTDDHTSPADAHPGDQRPGIEAELVHDVETYQSAGSAEPSPAMHRDSLTSLGVAFGEGDEVANYVVVRAGAVGELHFVHFDAISRELARVVKFVVESDYALDVEVEEGIDQVSRAHTMTCTTPSGKGGIDWARKGDDLVRDNPAQIRRFQHILEFSRVKTGFGVPSELNGAFNALETINHGEWEVVRSNPSVPERSYRVQIAVTKGILDLINCPFLADYQKSAHQESTVRLCRISGSAMMYDSFFPL